MVVELQVPRWSSDQWGSRGGWGLLVVGGVTIALGLAGLGGVLWAFASEQAVEPTGGLLAALASVALLAWAVPAVVLGRLLLRAPEVEAGDVALVIRDPALLAEPLVIPWAEVDRIEHVRELDPWGSPEGLNCSFTGVTSRPRPRFPNLLVRLAEARTVPEARAGWLGPWPLTVLAVPSPYLMPRPSRTHPTKGFFVVVPDPEAVIAKHDGARREQP